MSNNNFDKIAGIFTSLNDLYADLPDSKCLGCPSTGGAKVVAECCKRGVPPAYQVEFLNMLNATSDWSDDEKQDLILQCIEIARNPKMDKPCVFLGPDDGCKIYNNRPLNCRLYGMCGGVGDKPRAYAWSLERFEHEFANIEDAKFYFEKLFSGDFNPDKINAAIKRDFGVERESGIVNRECPNVAVENDVVVESDYKWNKLQDIESALLGADIKDDSNNSTYMAFHIALILHVYGEDALLEILKERGENIE